MSNSKRKVAKKKQRSKQMSNQLSMTAMILIVLGLIVAAIVIGLLVKNQQDKKAVDVTPTLGFKQYGAPPPMTIDTAKKYFATVKMAGGSEFVIELYPDKAPITVNSFVFLARDAYFDGVTFHRVIDQFMAQAGDPSGTGSGGPGYMFENEDSDLTFDKPGVVAMANAGRNTNGSQFFITFVPVQELNGGYTIFGQVVSGMDVVNGITRRDPRDYPDYSGDVIETVTITEE